MSSLAELEISPEHQIGPMSLPDILCRRCEPNWYRRMKVALRPLMEVETRTAAHFAEMFVLLIDVHTRLVEQDPVELHPDTICQERDIEDITVLCGRASYRLFSGKGFEKVHAVLEQHLGDQFVLTHRKCLHAASVELLRQATVVRNRGLAFHRVVEHLATFRQLVITITENRNDGPDDLKMLSMELLPQIIGAVFKLHDNLKSLDHDTLKAIDPDESTHARILEAQEDGEDLSGWFDNLHRAVDTTDAYMRLEGKATRQSKEMRRLLRKLRFDVITMMKGQTPKGMERRLSM